MSFAPKSSNVGIVREKLKSDASRAYITVEDSGPGIPAEVKAQMFDAFFTTKGQSLGLGLTLARQIAQFPQACMRLDRESSYDQWSQPLPDALITELQQGRAALHSPELAVDRFVDGTEDWGALVYEGAVASAASAAD